MDKRGLEIAVSTIILIILGILILIALLFLFGSQTNWFSDILKIFQGKSNLDSIVASCNVFAGNEQFFNYCCEKREIKAGGKDFNMTCSELKSNEIASGKINELKCDDVDCGE